MMEVFMFNGIRVVPPCSKIRIRNQSAWILKETSKKYLVITEKSRRFVFPFCCDGGWRIFARRGRREGWQARKSKVGKKHASGLWSRIRFRNMKRNRGSLRRFFCLNCQECLDCLSGLRVCGMYIENREHNWRNMMAMLVIVIVREHTVQEHINVYSVNSCTGW